MKIFQTVIFFITVSLFALGQVGRIGIGDYPVFIHLYEIPLALLILSLIFKRGLAPFNTPSGKLIKIMGVWMILSFLISTREYTWYENGVAALYLARLSMYVLLGIYAWHIKKFRFVLYALIAWFVATMAIQFFLYPNIGNIAYLGWDPHMYRAVGLFLDPPLAAAFLGLSGIYLYGDKNINPLYKYVALLLLLVLFILTYSRGAYIALVITLGYIFVRNMKIKLLSIILGSIVILFVLFGRTNVESTNMFRTTSIQSRIMDYQQGGEIWSRNILSGIGYNHIRFEKEQYVQDVFVEHYNPSHGIASFHSSFMIIGVTTGVVGLAIALMALFWLWKVNEFTRLAVLFVSVISLFDNVLLHPFVMVLFVLMFYTSEVK